jgi:ABC-type uncharacterized transport system substrate-binding protein
MKSMIRTFLVFCLALALSCAALPVLGVQPEKAARVALVVGGPFKTYQKVFQGLLKGLEERGLIVDGDVPVPEDHEDLASMWAWISAQDEGNRLVFPADAFYSAEWKQEERALVRQRLRERLREKGDIDFILALGTWAGQDFSTEGIHVPVLVASVTNAVDAGIIASPYDSGRDNLAAFIEIGQYGRQVRVFHEIFDFAKLGIVYEDTPSGRSSVDLSTIEETARDLDVELVRCTAAFDIKEANLAADRLRDCHGRLVEQGVDAVYLMYNRGLMPERMEEVLAPLVRASVPTFAQQGADAVAQGALISISQSNLLDEGRIVAAAMESILQGKKPRHLPQIFESTLSLAVNLRTAARIGWNLPLDILAAVDEFYQ